MLLKLEQNKSHVVDARKNKGHVVDIGINKSHVVDIIGTKQKPCC